MLRRWIAVFSLLSCLAAAHEVDPVAPLDFVPPPVGSYDLPVIMDSPDGTVLGVDGRPRSLKPFLRGHVTLLSFMYTRCRDPRGCPLAFETLLELKQQMAKDAGFSRDVRFVSLSFDPTHDTPLAMRRYGSHVMHSPGARWTFLTTPSDAALKPLLDGFAQDVSPGRDAATDRLDGSLSHVLKVFLLDRDGRVREIYSTSFLAPEMLRNDIETLRREAAQGGRAAPPERHGSTPGSSRHDPRSAEKASLGRKLFFDRRMSPNDTMSCAMCHIPEQGFTSNEMATAVGINGRSLRRNAPTSLNVGDIRELFVDGRATSLEEQVWAPLLARDEMGNDTRAAVVKRVRALPGYRTRFARAFGREVISESTIAAALAHYERTLVAVNSPFDRWRYGHEPRALSEEARAGYSVFVREGCVRCHTVGESAARFSDEAFHNTGIAWIGRDRRRAGKVAVRLAAGVGTTVDAAMVASVGDPEPDDSGRFEVTHRETDRDAYRTPSLRNVALTAPYMHDGSLPTLEAVVDFYERGAPRESGRDPGLEPRSLAAADKRALVAFLRSLTSPDVERLVRVARSSPPDQ